MGIGFATETLPSPPARWQNWLQGGRASTGQIYVPFSAIIKFYITELITVMTFTPPPERGRGVRFGTSAQVERSLEPFVVKTTAATGWLGYLIPHVQA